MKEDMKTIEVSAEMYDFLINLSKEIREQDNCATAMPYYFQVQEEKEIGVPEGCGEEVWVLDGEICIRTEEDIREAVFEWNCWELDNPKDQKKYLNLTSYEVEEILEKNYRKVNVDTTYTYSNVFFTKKAYEEHLRQNRHNLNNPTSYLFHAFRNPEMSKIFNFLLGLTKPN